MDRARVRVIRSGVDADRFQPRDRATARRSLSIDENSGLAWDMFGLVLYNGRQLPEARRAFERALSIDREAPRTLHHLGLVDEQDGRLEAASERYQRALTFDPKTVPTETENPLSSR